MIICTPKVSDFWGAYQFCSEKIKAGKRDKTLV